MSYWKFAVWIYDNNFTGGGFIQGTGENYTKAFKTSCLNHFDHWYLPHERPLFSELMNNSRRFSLNRVEYSSHALFHETDNLKCTSLQITSLLNLSECSSILSDFFFSEHVIRGIHQHYWLPFWLWKRESCVPLLFGVVHFIKHRNSYLESKCSSVQHTSLGRRVSPEHQNLITLSGIDSLSWESPHLDSSIII